jgi:hypothetical protein
VIHATEVMIEHIIELSEQEKNVFVKPNSVDDLFFENPFAEDPLLSIQYKIFHYALHSLITKYSRQSDPMSQLTLLYLGEVVHMYPVEKMISFGRKRANHLVFVPIPYREEEHYSTTMRQISEYLHTLDKENGFNQFLHFTEALSVAIHDVSLQLVKRPLST